MARVLPENETLYQTWSNDGRTLYKGALIACFFGIPGSACTVIDIYSDGRLDILGQFGVALDCLAFIALIPGLLGKEAFTARPKRIDEDPED